MSWPRLRRETGSDSPQSPGAPDGEGFRTHAIEYFVETCFDLARAGITPIVFALPWNRKPHPFLEVTGRPDLPRLRFEAKGEGG